MGFQPGTKHGRLRSSINRRPMLVGIVPSSHTCLLYHLIFATKRREPLITEGIRDDLHEYLGGTVRGLGGVPLGVGGVADHVHLLVSLNATHCLADFMRELKKCSSVWVAERSGNREFKWQEGYAAFTVSASSREGVRDYIARQEEHHRKKSSREELLELLRKCGVEFDERYFD
jgi:putative transposase